MVLFFTWFLRILIILILTFLGLNILCWLVLGAISLTVNLKKEYDTPSRFYNKVLNIGYRILCFYGRVKIHVTGLENVPTEKCFLLVSNHRSKFDNMIESYVLRRKPLSFISKKENFSIPIGRRLIKRACYFSLDRGNIKSAIEVIGNASKLIETGKSSVGVFPEGHRNIDGNMSQFMPGCFKVAVKSQCPIVVAFIKNTEKISSNFPWKRTHVYLDILKTFSEEEIKDKRTVEISDTIYSLMQKKS